jgi:serine/threonine protein kinase
MYIAMFADEARLVAMLDHPNVVRVFEVGEHAGLPFLAMELLHGCSVGWLQRHGARSPEEVLHIGIAAAAGLHHAHERRDAAGAPLHIVHRDVKPHNLFVTCDGTVKVLDFGVARARDRSVQTRSGVVKGTLRYLAPEQCRAQPVDPRADVFSLAVVLWELVTGQPLFLRDSDLETMLAITEHDAPRVTAIVPGTPAVLDAIIARALARDRDARFASADQLRAALVNAAAQLGISLPSEALAHRVREAASTGATSEPPPASEPVAPRSGPVTRRLATAPPTDTVVLDTDALITQPLAPRRAAAWRGRAKAAWIAGAGVAVALLLNLGRDAMRAASNREESTSAAPSSEPHAPSTPSTPDPLAAPAASLPSPAASPASPAPPAPPAPVTESMAPPTAPPASTAPVTESMAPPTAPPPTPPRKRPATKRTRPAPPKQRAWDPGSPLPPHP